MKGLLKRIRGWLGNAVVWGAAWSLAAIPVAGLLYVMGYGYLALPTAPRIAATLFAMGFVAGGSFSTYLALAYRNKGFDELRPRRFAFVGAVFGGLLVPVFGTVPGLVPGLGMYLGASFFGAIAASVGVAAVLGSATAFSTVKMAQTAALGSGSRGAGELTEGDPALFADETS